jgi:tRNA-2-methylthio-N6-dimethylallyladenosine synthase
VALQALQREIQLEIHAGLVGRTLPVLADAASRRRAWELSGRTSGNTVVNFPGEAAWIGQTVPVTIRRAGPNSLWGEAAEAPCR